MRSIDPSSGAHRYRFPADDWIKVEIRTSLDATGQHRTFQFDLPSPSPRARSWLEESCTRFCFAAASVLLRTKCLFHFKNTEDRLKHGIGSWKTSAAGRGGADQGGERAAQGFHEFYLECLGKHLKYSCCLYNKPGMTLDEAERRCCRTRPKDEIRSRQNNLELGCGWGSPLWMAQMYRFRRSRACQLWAEGVHRRAEELSGRTSPSSRDMVTFEAPEAGNYDRIVSIEMFEHMRTTTSCSRDYQVAQV